jgi:hypothetical protein
MQNNTACSLPAQVIAIDENLFYNERGLYWLVR